ncbi:MAG: primosomal protein N' [Dysgonamonadaceae bacterium]|jgi:primosomal protein N' (replication factor Y)|nr:primosomal protein N' [Dysgonamonadaceae bacterium]
MFVEVILPVPLPDSYTYSVPSDVEGKIKVGQLVCVPFGKGRQHIGIISGVTDTPSENIGHIKPIIKIEGDEPAVLPVQIRFWRWLAEYYLSYVGTVFHAAFPPGLQKKRLSRRRRRLTVSDVGATADGDGGLVGADGFDPRRKKVYDEITDRFSRKDVCLLHGATGGGGTEVYIHLIDDMIRRGRQVLCLTPQISPTERIISRFRQFFGDCLLVYHSKISERDRAEIWDRLLKSDEPVVVLGSRSSIFLPFRNLGLVIVDREHEPSYKQQDAAPRYHARDSAVVLAGFHGAKTLLAGATPSLESYRNAQTGKYGYVLVEDFVGTRADIISVDVKELRRKRLMKTMFSPLLLERMRAALERGGQVLLFISRRGFSSTLTCRVCERVPRCCFCDIGLSYHKRDDRLTCHYCGRTYSRPRVCADCGCEDFRPSGFGVEMAEEEVRMFFPGVSVARLDSDTAGNDRLSAGIIAGFGSGEIRILVGTQKIFGIPDFGGVSLAGILNVDLLMNLPDFRAFERTFQIVDRISRFTCGDGGGETVIQCFHPEDPLIGAIVGRDYCSMAGMQLEERRLFRYPPFSRIIGIDLRHREEGVVRAAADDFAALLRVVFGDRVVGPDRPSGGRIREGFTRRMLVKVGLGEGVTAVRRVILDSRDTLLGNSAYRGLSVVFDVDPVF